MIQLFRQESHLVLIGTNMLRRRPRSCHTSSQTPNTCSCHFLVLTIRYPPSSLHPTAHMAAILALRHGPAHLAYAGPPVLVNPSFLCSAEFEQPDANHP